MMTKILSPFFKISILFFSLQYYSQATPANTPIHRESQHHREICAKAIETQNAAVATNSSFGKDRILTPTEQRQTLNAMISSEGYGNPLYWITVTKPLEIRDKNNPLSPYSVIPFIANIYDHKLYLTLQHYFLSTAFKATAPDIEEAIMASDSAEKAQQIFETHREKIQNNWNNTSNSWMFKGLTLKFEKSEPLRFTLMQTKGRPIVFHDSDNYWGDHNDGNGLNRFGLYLMAYRDQNLLEENTFYLMLLAFLNANPSIVDIDYANLKGLNNVGLAPENGYPSAALQNLGYRSPLILSDEIKDSIRHYLGRIDQRDLENRLKSYFQEAFDLLLATIDENQIPTATLTLSVPTPELLALRSLVHQYEPFVMKLYESINHRDQTKTQGLQRRGPQQPWINMNSIRKSHQKLTNHISSTGLNGIFRLLLNGT